MRLSKWKVISLHLTLIFCVLVVALPVIYAISLSTLEVSQVYTYPPRLQIGSNMRANFVNAWNSINAGKLLFNSTFMSVSVALGKILLSITSAFALTFFGDFKFKNVLFVMILITHMLPLPIRIIPTYELMDSLGWLNSYYALTIPFFASATGTLLFRQFFMTVPSSLCDAARIDGAGPLTFLSRILLPLSKTNLVALFMIEFIYMWNQYLWPLLATTRSEMRVIQIGIKMLIPADAQPEWNVIMAAVIFAMIPPLIVLLLFQRTLTAGFALQQDK